MDISILTQGMYTLMLAGSAAVVLYAALVALRHVYPSLALFYGAKAISGAVPYGAVLAVVALGFAFTAYVTPATVMAGFAVLLLCGVAGMTPLPPLVLQLATFLAAGLALMADADVLRADGVSPMEMGVMAGFVAAPVLASMAPAGGTVNNGALLVLALVAGAAAVGAVVVTQSFAHGTAAAAILFATISVALFYMQRHHGAVGAGAMVALSLIAVHSALVLAVSGNMIIGLAMMGGVVAAAAIAASGRAVAMVTG